MADFNDYKLTDNEPQMLSATQYVELRKQLTQFLEEAEAGKTELTYADYEKFITLYVRLYKGLAEATETGRAYLAEDGYEGPTVQANTLNFNAREAILNERSVLSYLPKFKTTIIDNADGTPNQNVGKGATRDYSAESKSKVAADMRLSQKAWEAMPLAVRVNVARRIRAKIEQNLEFFVTTLMIELGKTEAIARGEMIKAMEYLDFATDKAILQETFSPKVISKKDAAGNNIFVASWNNLRAKLVGVIPAANYPVALMISQWINSIVCGSAVMHKPTGNSLLQAFALDDFAKQAMVEEFAEMSPEERAKIEATAIGRGKKIGDVVNLSDVASIKKFGGNISKTILGYDFGIQNVTDHLTFVGGLDAWISKIMPGRLTQKLRNLDMSETPELGGIGTQIIFKDGLGEGRVSIADRVKNVVANIVNNSGLRCTAVKIGLIEEGVSDEVTNAIEKALWDLQDKSKLGMSFRKGVVQGPSFNSDLVKDIANLKEILASLGLKEKTSLDDKDGQFFGGKPVNRLLDRNNVTPFYVDITSIIKGKNLDEIDPRLAELLFQKEIFGATYMTAKGLTQEEIKNYIERIELKLAVGVIGTEDQKAEIAMIGEYGSCSDYPKDITPDGPHGSQQGSGGVTHGGPNIMHGTSITKGEALNNEKELTSLYDRFKAKLGEFFKLPRPIEVGADRAGPVLGGK